MRRGFPIAALTSLLLLGSVAAHAEQAVKAPSGLALVQGESQGVWVGSTTFTDRTTEHLVERGDLGPAAGGATLQFGTYDDTERRLTTAAATIKATRCASGSACAPTVHGEFRSTERIEGKRESRWPRTCPNGGADTHSVRSVLNIAQTFRHVRGPAPAKLSVSWDAGRKAWIVDAGLLSGGVAAPLCEDLSNEIESANPGCGEPAPPKVTRASPSKAACVPPAMGRAFLVSAPENAARLTGAQTLEEASTPAGPASGAVKYRNGGVSVERKVVYDLTRLGGPPSN